MVLFYSGFGLYMVPFCLAFRLYMVPFYSAFSLYRVPFYSGFRLCMVPFYSGFGLYMVPFCLAFRLYMVPFYLAFRLYKVPFYSGFGLYRVYYTPAPLEGGILFYLCPSKIFFVAYFSATIDGRNLIFGHKLHIGMPYCGKRFWTRQIPTSCLLTLVGFYTHCGGIISEH
jgi:hypothetical protein